MLQKDDNLNNKPTHLKYVRLIFTFVFLLIILFISYVVIKKTGLWEKINSIEKLKAIVESGGVFSFVIFVVLQILQTTILQIPSILVTIAGTLVFGRWIAFILSFIAVMIGSCIMFWVGRKAGRKFLNWLIGKDDSNKWVERISHGKYLFFLMMLFPLFPDDILCAVAGLTNMSFGFFLITNLIARSIGIGCTVFFAGGTVIPFSGWGLAVWGVVLLVVGTLFYVSVKYQNKIDEIIKQFLNKNKKSP